MLFSLPEASLDSSLLLSSFEIYYRTSFGYSLPRVYFHLTYSYGFTNALKLKCRFVISYCHHEREPWTKRDSGHNFIASLLSSLSFEACLVLSGIRGTVMERVMLESLGNRLSHRKWSSNAENERVLQSWQSSTLKLKCLSIKILQYVWWHIRWHSWWNKAEVGKYTSHNDVVWMTKCHA